MSQRYMGSRDKALEVRDEDRLALKYYADGLAKFIGSCQTPMTIGVQGEWGSGKTSLMKLARVELRRRSEEDKAFPVIIDHWFDTWQYGAVGSADVLGVRLLQDLTEEIRRRGKQDDMALFKAADSVWQAARRIAPGVARAVTVGAATTASGGMVDSATLSSALAGGGEALNVGNIRDSFGTLVAHIVQEKTQKAGARVVVFIDDLDRIRPGRAVALLEILKNFMDVDNTVFVVACDYDVVLEGVKELMGIESPTKVRAFFHKIFQVPFEMPTASYSVQPLLREWLEAKLGKSGIGAELAKSLTPLVEAALGTNPRALKRFLNTVDLQCAVDAAYPTEAPCGTDLGAQHMKPVQKWKGKGVNAWVANLLGMFALQSTWPDVADFVLYDALGEREEAVATRRFEQALRTLSRDWNGWNLASSRKGKGELEEEPEEQPEEQLEALLRRTYGGPELKLDWQHPRLEQLSDFAALWFAALDQQVGGVGANTLTADEISWLWRWSQRMVAQRGSGAQRRGKWAFKELARNISPRHADAYLGLLDSVEQWCERNSVLTASYDRYGLWVRLLDITGKPQRFLQYKIERKQLLIKVRAAPSEDIKFGKEGLGELGLALRRCLEEEGFHPQVGYGYINIRFDDGHRDGDTAQMDRLTLAFKELLDGTVQLQPLRVFKQADERGKPPPQTEDGHLTENDELDRDCSSDIEQDES
jgi:hypothetical protein